MIVLQAKRVCPHVCHAKAETRPGQGQGGFHFGLGGRFCECLIQIGDQIIGIFDPD